MLEESPLHDPAEEPHPVAWGALLGVSCKSATSCTAVGYYVNDSTSVTLAERWNGTSWTIQSTPNPTGGSLLQLNGVSCTSTVACTAVGQYIITRVQVTLAERYS